MRRWLLIIGSLVVVVIAFAAYIELQTPPPAGGTVFQPTPAPPPPNTNNEDSQTLHDGTDGFVKSYDSKTKQLANEFRAATYEPQPDGTINMTQPDADFFLGGGQVLRIHGETGMVVDPNAAGGKLQGQSQMPSRGNMQHCVLRLFKAASDTVPQFTCWVNNLAFDNDTTTIVTQDCDLPDGHGNLVHTPFDQVPVHVIGIDYDFDGRGLTIKWNERDRHLEKLIIAHGEQLIIKHPNTMGGDEKGGEKGTTRPSDVPPADEVPGERGPVTLPSSPVSSGQFGGGPLRDADGPIALVSTSTDDATSAIGSALNPAPESASSAVTPATHPTTRPVKRKRRKPSTKPLPPPTSAPVIHRNKDAGVYRAVFSDNVHITQAGATLATGDTMNVDFFMGGGHASTEPSTQTATAPTGVGDAVSTETASGGTDGEEAATPATEETPKPPKQHKHATEDEADHPTPAPSTQPDVPIIVRWTGTLVVAAPPPDLAPLAVGDSVLQMVGNTAPAVLIRRDLARGASPTTAPSSVIHCASFTYHTLSKSVDLNNSTALPIVTVFDAKGTKIFAPAVSYDGSSTATIPGPAWAEFPVAGSSSAGTQPTTRPTQIAKADWSDLCTLALKPGEHGDMQVSEALLDGDVHVDHPQIKLNADELDMALDNLPRPASGAVPPAQGSGAMDSSAQLHEMNASGSVDCTLRDSQGRPQRIIADHLTFRQKRDATGTEVPRELVADGAVHTFDQTQSLNCEHLVAELEPMPQAVHTATAPVSGKSSGDVELRELTANDDVHFVNSTDGSFADSDSLHVETLKPAIGSAPADQEIELLGQPFARVGDKQNIVTGPIIHYNPGTKESHVIGPGTIHAVQQGTQQVIADSAHPGPSTRPIDVAWKTSFAMHGNDNRIKIVGDVHTRSIAADGTVDTAISDIVNITLIDAPPPTTSPATMASTAATAPATSPATAPSLLTKGDANFMKDKVVDTVTLLAKGDDDVEVSSIARDAKGAIIHAMNLYAVEAIYYKTIDKFVVPVPGRMLVRDFRSTSPATAPSDSSAGGMRGTSAFQWQKSLVYDQRADEAVMTGDVEVVHEAPAAASYQMWADKITAYMEPNSHPTTAPSTGPSTALASTRPTTQPIPSGEDTMKVKRMVAEGQVRMISQRLQFLAAQAIYDPQTQVMTAHGSERQPGEMLDEQGLSTAEFDDLLYNTASGQVQLKGFNGNMIK
jgi:lipopolysaccharide export system protein LptA